MALFFVSLQQTVQKGSSISAGQVRSVPVVARFVAQSSQLAREKRAWKISLPLTVSRHRLSLVQRKTLVLDLDETLIHSHHDGLPRNPSIKPGTPHDFTVSFSAKNQFFIHHKSPTLAVVRVKRRRKERNFHLSHRMICWACWRLHFSSPQVSVVIDRHPVRFFVHKRPHVDFFLDIVSQWYDLVVFTASMEIYGAAVADKLDNGRNILNRR